MGDLSNPSGLGFEKRVVTRQRPTAYHRNGKRWGRKEKGFPHLSLPTLAFFPIVAVGGWGGGIRGVVSDKPSGFGWATGLN